MRRVPVTAGLDRPQAANDSNWLGCAILTAWVSHTELTHGRLTGIKEMMLAPSTNPQSCGKRGSEGRTGMLWTIIVVLLALWLLGLVTSYTLGGFVHILLVAAIVIIVIRIIQGRRGII